jgi:hypothetical protein
MTSAYTKVAGGVSQECARCRSPTLMVIKEVEVATIKNSEPRSLTSLNQETMFCFIGNLNPKLFGR